MVKILSQKLTVNQTPVFDVFVRKGRLSEERFFNEVAYINFILNKDDLCLHHLVSHSFFELSTNFFLFEASKVAAAIGREKIKIFKYFQKEIKK